MSTSTLLLRLAATRQSWGEAGTERSRPTSKLPTFAGLQGLLSAALGLQRGERCAETPQLTIHVRVDRAGVPETDFHTVSAPPTELALIRQQNRRLQRYDSTLGRADFTVPLGNGKPWVVKNAVRAHISERQYLAGAEFIAAFSGADDVVGKVSDAIRHPVFSPYLGRAAFAPQFPFHLGVRPGTGLDVLETLHTTAPDGHMLRVHLITPGRPVQVARIVPPHTDTPLTDWLPL